MRKMHFFLLAATTLSCLAISGCKKQSPAPAGTVRIAIQPSAAFIPLYIARYTNLIETALKSRNVSVVWQDFESGPPINESLAADLTDIGVIGDVPTVMALASGDNMKLVGIPASGPDAYALLARADDASFQSAADLRGKHIATVFGSTGHNFTKKLLEQNALTFSDIDFSNIAAGEASKVLLSGAQDAIAIWEPNITRLIDSGKAKLVAQGSDTNLRGTNGFVVRAEYLAAHADIIRIILQQYAEAVAMLPSLSDDVYEKLSAALSITADQVRSVSKKYDYTVAITGSDIAALQDTISFLVSIGNLANEYRIENYVDRSVYTHE